MRDRFNKELNIGDYVISPIPNYHYMTTGIIVAMTKKMATIEYIDRYDKHIQFKRGFIDIVKITYEDYCNTREYV